MHNFYHGNILRQTATIGRNIVQEVAQEVAFLSIIEWDCKEEATGNRPCQSLMAVALGPSVISCGCYPVSMTGPHT